MNREAEIVREMQRRQVQREDEQNERIAELEEQLGELARWLVERCTEYFEESDCDTCENINTNCFDEPCYSCTYEDDKAENSRYERHPALLIADKWSKK